MFQNQFHLKKFGRNSKCDRDRINKVWKRIEKKEKGNKSPKSPKRKGKLKVQIEKEK